ncbi:MAG: hypothetical protein U1F36_16460 [Planctomycetota bacterium]
MRTLLRASLLALASRTILTAQCCLGEQDVVAQSANGRFQVEALARNGVGPQAHGPYRHLFRFCERGDDGTFCVERGRFELGFDTKAHFNMELWVSPSGNGVVVEGPQGGPLVLYARDGTKLAVVGSPDSAIHVRSASADGHILECTETNAGNSKVLRRFHVFLPLGEPLGDERIPPVGQAVVDPSAWTAPQGSEVHFPRDDAREIWLARMLDHSRVRTERDASEVARRIAELGSEQEGRADAATARLFELGFSATRALTAAGEGDGIATVRARAHDLLGRIRRASAGHSEPWRDLDLLRALTHHPDASLATAARVRLRRILPDGVDPQASGLVWDEDGERFVRH